MATWLRQSTEVIARFGPYIDRTDGYTEEVGLAGAATEISKNHGAFAAGPTLGTHDADGWYPITLTTTHTNTLGPLIVKGHDNATHLPVWREFLVVNTALFDAFCASSGGAIPNAVAGAAGGVQIAGSNAATTYASLTVTAATTLTGNVTLADGLTIAAPSTAGRAGLSITGNGAGAGAIITGGATGNGVTISAGATSGHGVIATATGTSFNGIRAVGSPTTGEGLRVIGGSTSGDGIGITTTSGHAISAVATGTTKHGIHATGGATTSNGINAVGGGVGHGIAATSGGGATGNGINAASAATAGNGLVATGNGTGHGAVLTSGTGATGDGVQMTAASTAGNGLKLTKTGAGVALASPTTDLVLAKTTNITGFNDIAATAIVSSGAITTSGGAVSTVTTTTNLTNLPAAAALEATLTAMKGATFNGATDSLEAIRDRGDAAWITATGFSTHSAADVWAVATRRLSDGTNIVLAKGVGITGFNDIAATDIVTAGAITTSTGAVSLTATEHANIADKILGRSLATGSDGGRTVQDALRTIRNKAAIAAGTLTVYQEDDVTPAYTAVVTTAAGDPIDSIDPT